MLQLGSEADSQSGEGGVGPKLMAKVVKAATEAATKIATGPAEGSGGSKADLFQQILKGVKKKLVVSVVSSTERSVGGGGYDYKGSRATLIGTTDFGGTQAIQFAGAGGLDIDMRALGSSLAFIVTCNQRLVGFSTSSLESRCAN